jgi:GNAT superfamily N-acetyltransferase
VFKATKATVTAADNLKTSWLIPQVAVTMESRIAAVGDGAQAAVALLLGDAQEDSGTVTRHASLLVANLGPHLGGSSASSSEHAAAVAAALEKKPQVVILREALSGGDGWARTFQDIIRGQALAGFKGAVIVACDRDVTFAIRRVCSEQWYTSKTEVMQQDMPGRQFQIIEDVLKKPCQEESNSPGKAKGGRASKKQAKSDAADTECLVEEIRNLYDYWFEEDLLKRAGKEGWIVAVLTEDSGDGSCGLRAFLCYRFAESSVGREVQIERLAVPRSHKRRGFGSMMIRWIAEEMARNPQSDCVAFTCNALSNVVDFYGRHGFKANVNRQPPQEEDDEDPNTFMELANVSLVAAQA